MTEQEYEKLGLSNDFIFSKVMQEADICKQMLEIILEIKIHHITYPEAQKTIDLTADARGVRLDIYVEDDAQTVYNIEMQTVCQVALAQRSRYYQGMIDMQLIQKGEFYNKLKDSYIIFLCTFDPFGRKQCKYTFENRCEDIPDLKLGDGATKIFLNTNGENENVSEEMRKVLAFVAGGLPQSDFTRKLQEKVNHVKSNEDWRKDIMTLQAKYQEQHYLGKEEGKVEGKVEGKEEGKEEIVLQALRNCKSIQTTASFLALDLDYVRQIALDNRLTDLVDLQQ